MREAVAALLRAGDPAAHRRLKTAAWHQLRSEMRDAHPAELWRYTADMLYLLENPALREIYFPTTAPDARPRAGAARTTGPGIEAIVREHETPEHAAVIRRYWESAPETFVVARDAGGDLTGFYFLFVPRDVSPRLLDADPVAIAWREHLRRNPLPHGQIALFIRQLGHGAGGGREPAPGEPSICLDIKRTYLELRPALGRVYLGVQRPRRARGEAGRARASTTRRASRPASAPRRTTRCSPTSAPARSTAGSPTSARASCT